MPQHQPGLRGSSACAVLVPAVTFAVDKAAAMAERAWMARYGGAPEGGRSQGLSRQAGLPLVLSREVQADVHATVDRVADWSYP
jgi:hypothetical protein